MSAPSSRLGLLLIRTVPALILLMAPEAMKDVNVASFDIINYSRLFGYFLDMARYFVLHMFARGRLLHLIQVF
jgi:hypothetical protein